MTPVPRRMFRFSLRSKLHQSAAGGLLAALLCVPAFADELADVNRFIRANQHAEALLRADAYLAKNPRDVQMRFLKGVILAEQNKPAEAIAIFQKLTEDHPSLPEPYNNLAVLYAASGQYEKARAALDAAIRTNPSYATAYENLGDVHAKLASQAYDKALQLESGNAAAKSRLTLVRSMNGTGDATRLAGVPTPAARPAPPPARPAEQLAMARPEPAAPPAKPVEPPARQEPRAEAAKPQPRAEPPRAEAPKAEAPKAEAKPMPPKAEPPRPAPRPSNAERNEVAEVVEAWARAWSAQDVKSYLAFYGNDFQTPGGQSRKAWEDDRRARIAGKGSIKVRIESPQVSVEGNNATVRFRQVYISDRLTATTRKTLVLARQGGRWKIKQENTGS
ncbi:nuclear transport factor 2 family protein [Noviherbaspirillum aridicola]|nr:tetratricopeptide repeat protein [Noviherbaspirillum aridicola]